MIAAAVTYNGAASRSRAALKQERELQRQKGLGATRGGAKSDTMRALRAAEDARAREAWLTSPERAAQRLARRQAAQATLQGSRGGIKHPSPGATSQQQQPSAAGEASATSLIPLLDMLLSEQATLTQIMKGFDLQLQAGADGEHLLCSSSFQEALARLGAAQQQQHELLSVARERIVRDYPMLLEASRSLLELLSAVTARANRDMNGELQQAVPTLAQTHSGQGGRERASAESHHARRCGGTRLRLPFRGQGDPIYRTLPVEHTE